METNLLDDGDRKTIFKTATVAWNVYDYSMIVDRSAKEDAQGKSNAIRSLWHAGINLFQKHLLSLSEKIIATLTVIEKQDNW